MAREDYPDAYRFISESDCWRPMILELWGRAWLYLELTEGMSALGIKDAEILTRLSPELLEEIDRLRELEGCEQ